MKADGGGGAARLEPTWHHWSTLMRTNRAPVGDRSELCNTTGNATRRHMRTLSFCCSFIYGCLQAGLTAGDWKEASIVKTGILNNCEHTSLKGHVMFLKCFYCSFSCHFIVILQRDFFFCFTYLNSISRLPTQIESLKRVLVSQSGHIFALTNRNRNVLITIDGEKLFFFAAKGAVSRKMKHRGLKDQTLLTDLIALKNNLQTKVKTPLRNRLHESQQMFCGRNSEDCPCAAGGKGWQEDSSCCWASQPTHCTTTHTNTRDHGNAATPASARGARDVLSTSPLPHHERGAARQHSDDVTGGCGCCSLGAREWGGASTSSWLSAI